MAQILAIHDATSKCLAYANIKCQECSVPGQCWPGVDLLPAGWTLEVFPIDGGFHALATYKGPYMGYCTPCPI